MESPSIQCLRAFGVGASVRTHANMWESDGNGELLSLLHPSANCCYCSDYHSVSDLALLLLRWRERERRDESRGQCMRVETVGTVCLSLVSHTYTRCRQQERRRPVEGRSRAEAAVNRRHRARPLGGSKKFERADAARSAVHERLTSHCPTVRWSRETHEHERPSLRRSPRMCAGTGAARPRIHTTYE